ncbi:MAG TPA: hypothetical protein VKQ52_20520 [Puia sp.]|nr:hypothetical protein [Puia sp.]
MFYCAFGTPPVFCDVNRIADDGFGKTYKAMKYTILILLLVSATMATARAQFLKKIVSKALSGGGNKDSANHPQHHGKDNPLDNILNRTGSSGRDRDSSLILAKDDDVKATHGDLSRFNARPYYTLLEGEKFTFYEACLLMQADQLNPRILVVKDRKPWLIGANGEHIAVDPRKVSACPLNSRRTNMALLASLNGDQSEPYARQPSIFAVRSPGGGAVANELGFDTAALAGMQKSLDAGDSAAAFRQAMTMQKPVANEAMAFKPRTTIVFRGKTFGPYMEVRSYVFDRGAGKFLAVVDLRRPNTDITTIKGDFSRLVEPWLIGSDGTKVKLPDGEARIVADENLAFVRIYIVKRASGDGGVVHASLFDPVAHLNTPVFTNEDGSGNPGITQNIDIPTGNLVTKQLDGQRIKVYINDKCVTTLDGESDIPFPNVFLNKDASRWAIWGTRALYFSNGETVDGVIAVRVADRSGRTSLNWIALGSDNKTLQICHCEL